MERLVVVLAVAMGCASSAAPVTPVPVVAARKPSQHAVGPPARITFDGNASVPSADLLRLMESNGPAMGPWNVDVLDRDILVLTSRYYELGFLDVKLSNPIVTPTTGERYTDIRFHIEEGVRYRLGQLAVQEVDDAGQVVTPLGTGDLRRRFTIKDGDWFDRSAFMRDHDLLTRLYGDAGYANVDAPPQATLDRANATIDLTIDIHRGAPVVFDHLVITGTPPTDKLRREIAIPDGMRYSESALDAITPRLKAHHPLFSDVTISTRKTPSDPNRVIVTVEVTEAP